MLQSFVVTLRETLEAALIVGIVLSYLAKIKQTQYNKLIFISVGAGILASIIFAFVFTQLASGFEGRNEEIFEGVTMLITVVFLTFMILWMLRNKQISTDLQNKIDVAVKGSYKYGLFILVFIAIFREGIETVLYLWGIDRVNDGINIISALSGIVVAIVLGYIIFRTSLRVNLKVFFNLTSTLLIFFAAGLLAHGVHELQEAGVIPIVTEHVWDINPPVVEEGVFPLLHEKGFIGGFMKDLFGYNGNPSLIEVVSYFLYFIVAFGLWANINRKQRKLAPAP
ncbi:MAG: FTR1 family protein [Bacteroidetes bacterium]|nr:FTR1 family protein [Bacteroidota bacterium]